MRNTKKCNAFIMAFIFFLTTYSLSAQKVDINTALLNKVEAEVSELMEDGEIPGLSLIIINDGQELIKNYGFADLELQKPVTSKTLFEIGSSTKAYTGLALANLIYQNRLDVNSKVSDFLPWFSVTFEEKPVDILVSQLLHHTSGIPWHTISKIPESTEADALEITVKGLIGQELDFLPGAEYNYATINYDILALIAQKITNQSFESYLQDSIINKIGLDYTSIGKPKDPSLLATGYKMGFLDPRPYDAPRYKGNNAAGYVISNAEDMAQWLKFQLGMTASPLSPVLELTHQRDKTVPLHDMSAYAKGWNIALDGTGEIYHGGLNPNFTSWVVFRPEDKIGVAILANSNSNFTFAIGRNVMKILNGEELDRKLDPDDGMDVTFSLVAVIICLYILIVLTFLFFVLKDIVLGERKYKSVSLAALRSFLVSLLAIIPFAFSIYYMPHAFLNFSWEAVFVWMPKSLKPLLIICAIGALLTYLVSLVALFFPEKNKYKKMAPKILLMSVILGLSSILVIVVVTSAIGSEVELKYILSYYGLILSIYLIGRHFVQTSLIKFSNGLIYDLRLRIIKKIFSTSYHKFERIDRGRVYTTLNDDISTIGQTTDVFVTLINSVITTVGAFIYLAAIALWATMLNVLILIVLSGLIFYILRNARQYFEAARDERNVFMGLINGMIDGFKEISLHRNKKIEFQQDVEVSANEFKEKMITADIKSFTSAIVGESMLVLLLGLAAFVMPELFPHIKDYKIMSFIIVLLYLIGPVNNILNIMPILTNAYVSWNRVQIFIKEIPANIDMDKLAPPIHREVESLSLVDVGFKYKNKDQLDVFGVGPINFEAKKGEIVFIIGGNGSGKTTLAKLITGLYEPDEGVVLINNKTAKHTEISENFSTVFSPSYLFEKLYNIDVENKKDEIAHYLRILDLDKKVTISKNEYSTINLSAGQRKRLALLQCYLEDSPIYLFDEWAADQDPGYRKFFYRTLLPEMKKQGKIVIAITHDDHYFDVADKIFEMDFGKLKPFSKASTLAAISSKKVV